jgi:hypothetical protein
MKGDTMSYRVTYAVDSLDPNPMVMEFSEEWEMYEWLHEEMDQRIQFTVEHSPHTVEEDEMNLLYEVEASLVSIEKL